MAVDKIFRDIAIANSETQPQMVDNLLEEAPIVAGMPMQPSTHGFQNLFEEIKEVTISTGLEYWYREIFSFRGGYFLENMDKGGRKFLTLGLGIKYNNLGIDFSYLSTPQNDHPLAETMRFSLSFLFDKVEDADSN